MSETLKWVISFGIVLGGPIVVAIWHRRYCSRRDGGMKRD